MLLSTAKVPPPFNIKGGGVTFRFSNLLRRLDIELLLCVCWLDKVGLLVFQISCIQGTTLYPVSCRTLSFSQCHPWMSIILTRTHLVLLSISHVQEAVLCLPRFWTPQSVVLTTYHSQDDTDSDASWLTSVGGQTQRLCGQRVCVVYGDWQMFLPTGNCVSCVMFLRQTACHRGWSPLPSPLPNLLPKLLNLVPNPQPRVQPNLLPRWHPSLQPGLQLESPFQ